MNYKADITIIEQEIAMKGWYFFGDKEFYCPGITKANLDYYIHHKELPSVCNSCFKALIFWSFSEENVKNLFTMFTEMRLTLSGKLNQGVIVFYFDDKQKMLEYIDLLKINLQKFKIQGNVQWRRACKEYQDQEPNWWKNAKEFIPA